MKEAVFNFVLEQTIKVLLIRIQIIIENIINMVKLASSCQFDSKKISSGGKHYTVSNF